MSLHLYPINIRKVIYDWYEEKRCVLTVVVVRNRLQEQIVGYMFKSSGKIFRDKEKVKVKVKIWRDNTYRSRTQNNMPSVYFLSIVFYLFLNIFS